MQAGSDNLPPEMSLALNKCVQQETGESRPRAFDLLDALQFRRIHRSLMLAPRWKLTSLIALGFVGHRAYR